MLSHGRIETTVRRRNEEEDDAAIASAWNIGCGLLLIACRWNLRLAFSRRQMFRILLV